MVPTGGMVSTVTEMLVMLTAPLASVTRTWMTLASSWSSIWACHCSRPSTEDHSPPQGRTSTEVRGA